MNRGEQIELHELRLLRSVVRSIYYSADDEEDSEVEDAVEDPIPAEDGLRLFVPPLVASDPLEAVQEVDESSSSEHSGSTPCIPPMAGQYQSELAREFHSRLVQDLSSAEDYDISGLWNEDDREHTVEQVNKFFLHNTFSHNLSQSFCSTWIS